MSILTTAPIKVWPSAAASITLATSASQGEFTAWTEFIPALSISSPIAIVGIVAELYNGSTTGNDNLVMEFGTGAAGFEEAISAPLLISANQVNCAYEATMLPVAIGNIAANARLSVRIRSIIASSTTYHFALMYSENLPDDGTTTGAYAYTPTATGSSWPASGALLTPNATAWANSAWVEVDALAGAATTILGIGPQPGSSWGGESFEIDIGAGDSGSEVVLTTLRNTFPWIGIQGFDNTWLPAGYPIWVDSRLALRIRASWNSADTMRAHLIYLEQPPTPPAPSTTTYQAVRERVFALPFGDNLMTFLERIEFLIQAAPGLVTGQGSDPVVAVWFSKDGGVTYGNGYTLYPGKVGEYTKRTYINRLGRARNWVCKVRVSDPVFWAFLECYATMTEGTS